MCLSKFAAHRHKLPKRRRILRIRHTRKVDLQTLLVLLTITLAMQNSVVVIENIYRSKRAVFGGLPRCRAAKLCFAVALSNFFEAMPPLGGGAARIIRVTGRKSTAFPLGERIRLRHKRQPDPSRDLAR